MLDPMMRRLTQPPLDHAADLLGRTPVTPGSLTALGLLTGLGAAVAAAATWWTVALVAWLVSRLLDGLDGPLARALGTADDGGGFADVMADFTVYAAFVVGLAVAIPEARLAVAFLLATYYVSATALLSWSALAARRDVATDGRSLHLTGGLAEGTETIAVYAVITLIPQHAVTLLWAFSVVVGITAAQRTYRAHRWLRAERSPASPALRLGERHRSSEPLSDTRPGPCRPDGSP
jgi:phosphatidylglycerophosphate synthase